jgi:hypothetical protein
MGQLCLNGGGCAIRFRRRDKIGTPGFDFDAVVTDTATGDQFLVGMDKQKEPEAKENDHGRCCDTAERNEVEQGSDIRFRHPGPLIRGSESVPGVLADRGPEFWGMLRRTSCRTSSSNTCFPSIRRCISRSSVSGSTSHDTSGERRPEGRPLSSSSPELPSVLAESLIGGAALAVALGCRAGWVRSGTGIPQRASASGEQHRQTDQGRPYHLP